MRTRSFSSSYDNGNNFLRTILKYQNWNSDQSDHTLIRTARIMHSPAPTPSRSKAHVIPWRWTCDHKALVVFVVTSVATINKALFACYPWSPPREKKKKTGNKTAPWFGLVLNICFLGFEWGRLDPFTLFWPGVGTTLYIFLFWFKINIWQVLPVMFLELSKSFHHFFMSHKLTFQTRFVCFLISYQVKYLYCFLGWDFDLSWWVWSHVKWNVENLQIIIFIYCNLRISSGWQWHLGGRSWWISMSLRPKRSM